MFAHNSIGQQGYLSLRMVYYNNFDFGRVISGNMQHLSQIDAGYQLIAKGYGTGTFTGFNVGIQHLFAYGNIGNGNDEILIFDAKQQGVEDRHGLLERDGKTGSFFSL